MRAYIYLHVYMQYIYRPEGFSKVYKRQYGAFADHRQRVPASQANRTARRGARSIGRSLPAGEGRHVRLGEVPADPGVYVGAEGGANRPDVVGVLL